MGMEMTPEEMNEIRLNLQKEIEENIQGLISGIPEIKVSLADRVRAVMQQHPLRQYEEMTQEDEDALLNDGILNLRYRDFSHFLPPAITIVCTRDADGSIKPN